MKRLIFDKLLNWKNSINRKPLIVYGARQIGKTYTILDFGKTEYDNVLYCNFENDKELHKLFDRNLNPERIIEALKVYYSCSVIKGKTLIFFDEIQACEAALTSLKYFNEEANDYHIIACIFKPQNRFCYKSQRQQYIIHITVAVSAEHILPYQICATAHQSRSIKNKCKNTSNRF